MSSEKAAYGIGTRLRDCHIFFSRGACQLTTALVLALRVFVPSNTPSYQTMTASRNWRTLLAATRLRARSLQGKLD